MARFANLADFVRKAQLANYEAFRAMYEGRNAQLFHPTTAIITWMSNPAQPSFVWQIYHYDLEPMSSFFAVMHASELVHIQFNEATGDVQVINNLPDAVADAVAHVAVYNLDGSLAYQHEIPVTAPCRCRHQPRPHRFPATLSAVHFIKLDLRDAAGKPDLQQFLLARSARPSRRPDRTRTSCPMVTLEAKAERKDEDGKRLLSRSRCTIRRQASP